MTLQDSESVGQSQLRAGWSTRLFSATREGFPLVPALWPVLLSHWPRATEASRERSRIATSDVLCARRKSHGGDRRSWNLSSLKIGILQEQQRSYITHILLNIKTF